MHPTETGSTFLINQFGEFCGEMIRLKHAVKSGAWVFPAEGVSEEGREGTQATNPVWQRLLSLLEQQALTAGRSAGDYGFALYKEAQYIMAALADETFLQLEWEGKEFWSAHLLEAKLFDSHVAGELLFKKMDGLLQDRDPVYRDLAAMHLTALSLGFRGKFYGVDDRGQIDSYRRRLFDFLFQRDADLGDESKLLFPKAYRYTLEEGMGRRLPNPRRWMVALGAVVLALGLISHVLWTGLSADLERVTQRILQVK